ncbi:FxsA [Oceaniovalibus guishaninsula JLT2003]|uniref:FxsA n=1 Tax=Oceaniovalibus guishaninsula JLT2003 TaxID=1231392 RepID=K2HP90_9RHOB|nr:FxsA family protein [Oceaniovalibus guishaninsula]EKE44679.1 FxsA [Oceaniovalibus guishaninsula JLT2003]
MWLFVPFVLIPLIEIALFIQVGGLIGLWPTLAIVVMTAIAGTSMMRSQGAMAMADLRRSMHDLRDPTEPLAHGAMILLAGALLLTPGFFTDACGLLLLVPPVRRAALRELRRRVKIQHFAYGPSTPPGAGPRGPAGRGDIIEGDFTEEPAPRADRGPSGWTRH